MTRQPLTVLQASCFVGAVVVLPMTAVCAFSLWMTRDEKGPGR